MKDAAMKTGMPSVEPEQRTPTLDGAVQVVRPRVLCVDDSATVRTTVEHLLGEQYQFDFACDGAEALEQVRRGAPDAILCDYSMPGMSGMELLVEMQRDPVLARIPFIAMTGAAEGWTASQSIEAGAHDFLTKPFSPQELRARIGAAIRSRLTYKELERQHQELARMHSQLSLSEARSWAVFQSASSGIVIMSVDGTIEEFNPAAEKMFGWKGVDGWGFRFLDIMVAPRSRQYVEAVIASVIENGAPQLQPQDLFGLRRNGQEFPMEFRITRLDSIDGRRTCAFVRDMTEAKQLQLELQQSQKLEAVGRLAAGIAHEINTPIQFIGDNTRFLDDAFKQIISLVQSYRELITKGDRASDEVHRAEELAEQAEIDYLAEQVPLTVGRTLEGVRRVATIVRAMKEFAHPDQKEMVATDLNRALQATLEVARNEYKYVAEVETAFGPIPLVTCYAGDLNQVFLNIIVNAAHAMADVQKTSGALGKLRIETSHQDGIVVVSIQDTGPGIPELIRDKIFDPFFTTKEVGRGTGQGLTLARTIVEKHHGELTFQSTVGVGTAFFVRLPIDGRSKQGGGT
jgi:PAS domain S-box-containing protein